MSATTPATTTPPKSKPAKRRTGSPAIDRRRLVERDGARRDWQVQLEPGETLEDALEPRFFGQSAPRLGPHDRIVVVGDGMSFWAEFVVVRADASLLSVWCALLQGPIDLAQQIAKLQGFDFDLCRIEEAGGSWRVACGHHQVEGGFPSKAHAEKWLAERRRESVV